MAREVFVDCSGLYALADRRDGSHSAAARCVANLATASVPLVLSDYVLDEAITLARARAGHHGASRLMDIVEQSVAFRLVWIGEERFESAKRFFRKHSDHDYSFTDCTSFILMEELRIREALTTDRHYVEAGFRTLLPVA